MKKFGFHKGTKAEVKFIDRTLDRARLDRLMVELPTDDALDFLNIWVTQDSLRAKLAETSAVTPERVVVAFCPPDRRFMGADGSGHGYKLIPTTNRSVPAVLNSVQRESYRVAASLGHPESVELGAFAKIGNTAYQFSGRQPGRSALWILTRMELLWLSEVYRLHPEGTPEGFRRHAIEFGAAWPSTVALDERPKMIVALHEAPVVVADDGENKIVVYGRARCREAAAAGDEDVMALRVPVQPGTDDLDALAELVAAERGDEPGEEVQP